jgi:cortexillin 1/2
LGLHLTFRAVDFVDGNLKLILGFLWTMLRTFRTFGDGDSKDDGGRYEDALLAWLRETLSEYDLKINDFTTSFQDGRVLLALLNKMDDSYVDFGAVDAVRVYFSFLLLCTV